MKERPLRIFVQAEKISRHLHCPICHQVFDDPNRLGCGHTFCYMCIQQWASLSKACPLCKKSLKHRRPQKDLIAASLIDEMQAKCSHEKCEWTGVYSSLKKHQRMCEYRERKTYQSRNFDQIVEVNDDEEMKEANELNKKGRKKLKEESGQLLPVFPSSSVEQQQNVNNIEPVQRNLQHNSQVISSQSGSSSYSQSISNPSSSISSNSSLNLNLSQLFQNRSIINVQNTQSDGYLYNPCQIEKKSQKQKDQLIDFHDMRHLESNYFIIQKNRKEQEQIKKQSKEIKNKWGLGHYLQTKKQEKQQKYKEKQQKCRQNEEQSSDDSSSLSNPFNEPIIEIKKNTPKIIIEIDSSEQSRLDHELQSGEMSFSDKQNYHQEKTSQKVQIQRQINKSLNCNKIQQYKEKII